MAGVKGRSGTNKGKDKPFAEALRMEIAAAGEDHKALRRIAAKLIEMAEGGDMQAINAIADRLDGKPVQAVDMTSETTVRYVARVPDKKADAASWQEQHAPVKMPTIQ